MKKILEKITGKQVKQPAKLNEDQIRTVAGGAKEKFERIPISH